MQPGGHATGWGANGEEDIHAFWQGTKEERRPCSHVSVPRGRVPVGEK